MRIATWNCAGAFRTKVERALSLDADLTVIQEAEDPALYRDQIPTGSKVFWFARPQDRKGILAFTRPGFTIRPHRSRLRSPPFNHFIPLTMTTPTGQTIVVFHVWTLGARPREAAYVGQAHLALDHYAGLVSKPGREASGRVRAGTVLVGDFNSNAYWDSDRRRNHTLLVERLAAHGIQSAYHLAQGEAHGAESKSTFYLYRKIERAYHLDYCFTDLPVRGVEVGAYADWSGLKSLGGVSDHVPLVATLTVPPT